LDLTTIKKKNKLRNCTSWRQDKRGTRGRQNHRWCALLAGPNRGAPKKRIFANRVLLHGTGMRNLKPAPKPKIERRAQPVSSKQEWKSWPSPAEECPSTIIEDHLPLALDENGIDCLLTREVPGDDVEKLLCGLWLIMVELMH
jgi:hypothetical protein